MKLIHKKVNRKTLKFSPGAKMNVAQQERYAYVCPHCGGIVSYIPMTSLTRCAHCSGKIDWDN